MATTLNLIDTIALAFHIMSGRSVAVNAVGCHMKTEEISCGCQQEPGLTCIEAGEP